MKLTLTLLTLLTTLAASTPLPHTTNSLLTRTPASGSDIIAQLQSTFDRNNPNGTPTSANDPDDLNGDGVINVFEAGAQASKREVEERGLIEDLQATFDRNSAKGTPANGSPDDLNGDGVINAFEAGAQAS